MVERHGRLANLWRRLAQKLRPPAGGGAQGRRPAVPARDHRVGHDHAHLAMPRSRIHRRVAVRAHLARAEKLRFAALKEFVPTKQVLFGSDWPMVNARVVKIETTGLESSKVLDDAARRAIDRDNALALFPRFASKAAKAA